MHPARRGLFWLACLSAALGCGEGKDPHGRLPLRGSVTFQGKPLDAGTIEFLPSSPDVSLSARSLIRSGQYRIPREQGLPPGTYRVLISSPTADETAEPVGPPGMKLPPLGRERIPPRYNRDSRETVEVKAPGENTFDFTIEQEG
jgi:hypothetical protein